MQESDRQKVLQWLVKDLLLRKRYSETEERLAALAEGPKKAAMEQVIHREFSDQPTVAKADGPVEQCAGAVLHQATYGRRCRVIFLWV
jgi:hypothetical protein